MFTKMLQRRCLSKKITPVRGKLLPLSGAGCPEVPFVEAKPKKVSKTPVYPKVSTKKTLFFYFLTIKLAGGLCEDHRP